MQPHYREGVRGRWREEEKRKKRLRKRWRTTVFSEKRKKVGWKEVREGGMADTKRRRGKETGGGLGLVRCQLRHWTYATVAASKISSQITDAAQWRTPPSTATPL